MNSTCFSFAPFTRIAALLLLPETADITSFSIALSQLMITIRFRPCIFLQLNGADVCYTFVAAIIQWVCSVYSSGYLVVCNIRCCCCGCCCYVVTTTATFTNIIVQIVWILYLKI